ncbi:amidohydrolase family protein [Acidobacteriota bacterium]
MKKVFCLFMFLLLISSFVIADEVIVFKNVNLVPMTNNKVLKNQDIIIKGNVISDFGPTNKLKIPENATIIDGSGAYLMPGLADMHVHLSNYWKTSQFNLYVAQGVTTARDMNGEPEMLNWREEIDSGKRIGPNLYISAPTIRGNEKEPWKYVSSCKKLGYDFIKIYSFISPEDYKLTIDEIKKNQLYSAGHIPFMLGIDGVIQNKMNEIAHVEEFFYEIIKLDRSLNLKGMPRLQQVIESSINAFPDYDSLSGKEFRERIRDQVKKIAQKVKSANIAVNTTLAVDEIVKLKLFEEEKIWQKPSSKYYPQFFIDKMKNGTDKHKYLFKDHKDIGRLLYEFSLELLTQLRTVGVEINLGTDAGAALGVGTVPGFSIHDELQILVECGFSPYEAIATGTVNAAKVVENMTGKNNFGSVEIGKRADLLLINNNPFKNVKNIKDLKGVMIAGKWLDKTQLDELLAVEQTTVKELAQIIGPIFQKEGSQAAIAKYNRMKNNDYLNQYYFDVSLLNLIGNDLLKNGLTDLAIDAFKLNMEEYPASSKVYDSMGKAYTTVGKKELAIQYYKKSLEIDHNNRNAVRMIKKLE